MPKYTVTGSAPDDIYGQSVKENDVLNLTEQQAEHHVMKGHLFAGERLPPADESGEVREAGSSGVELFGTEAAVGEDATAVLGEESEVPKANHGKRN